MDRCDVAIVGAGPAGLSAALLLARSCRSVRVLDAGEPRNARASAVHGFLTREGTPPGEMRRLAHEELARYGVRVEATRVLAARPRSGEGPPGGWEVEPEGGIPFFARKLVLATGVLDLAPDIPGVRRFWGSSVVVCPYCDAWEHRGEPLAVYGWDDGAAAAAVALLTWTRRVALLTDGHGAPGDPRLARHGIAVHTARVAALDGRDVLEGVRFSDGGIVACRAMFVHAGQVRHDALPVVLGCVLDDDGRIRVDREGKTGCPGLWACGDVSSGVELAVIAAAEGARVAVSVNKELREEDFP